MNEINIGTKVAMVLTDMPLGVSVGKEHFYLYPQTLGRMYLTSQLIDKLEISQDNLKINSFMEALRTVTNHRKESCQLIAYHTLRKKAEMLNTKTLDRRVGTLMRNCNKKNLATLLITILADSTLNDITKDFGIDNESQRMDKINKAKDTKNQYVFGGKSIWGALIDAACERYGWTFDYVVWGISYNNLTLMMKDKITSIYLSDEERKKAHIPAANEEVIDGNNKDAIMKAVMESELNPE